jgi:signal transduction histidine kinase/ligand-binding sensor domain-containing protein
VKSVYHYRNWTAADCSHMATAFTVAKIVKLRLLRIAVLFILATWLCCGASFAESFERTIGQFQHTGWGAKDGAPSNIRALAQTNDGYLWLGTNDGLYRFDGVSFERYEPRSGGPFPGRGVLCLLAVPNGDLWIGFWLGSISVLSHGHVTSFTAKDGVPSSPIVSFAQDTGGTMWAATLSGLIRLEGGRWKIVGREWGYPGTLAAAVFVDRHGTLWVATENTIVFLPPGAKQFQPTGIHVGQVPQIAEAPNGKLWMAETTRSVRPLPLGNHLPPSDDAEIRVGSIGILFDRDGALWATTIGDGIRRFQHIEHLSGKPGRFSSAVESYTAKDGLTDDFSESVLQDHEGNIWVGSRNGLDRFRESPFVPVRLPVPARELNLAAGNEGELWVRGTNLSVRIDGNHADEIADALGSQTETVHTTCRDPGGSIWWIEKSALRRVTEHQVTLIPVPDELHGGLLGVVCTSDRDGALWLAYEGKGLFYVMGNAWKRVETPPEVAKQRPLVAFTDDLGRLWFGYSSGALIRIEHGLIKIIWPAGHSPLGAVRSIQGRMGHIWIGGEKGFGFFDGSGFHSVFPSDGSSFDPIVGIQETGDGSLWLAEIPGVIHIGASAVTNLLSRSSDRVAYDFFDSLDGVPGKFHDSNAAEIQGTDGRLWFGASDGIAWLDPTSVPRNLLFPQVSILSFTADKKAYPFWTSVTLPARSKELQIRFTALSLSVPEKVRFRYRLEGFDSDWQDAGTRREAFFTNLGPGKYRFHVIACNNDSVWNEAGATIEFRITPAWYQPVWFGLACVAAFALLLWTLYQLRLRQLARQFNVRLEERVGERTRIARELHDTLLQNLHGLMFQFQAASNLVEKRPEDAKKTLDSAIDGTEKAIAESQDAIRELRSEQMAGNNLGELLTRMANELSSSQCANPSPPAFSIIEEGEAQVLHPSVQDEVYRIAREVIRNAFQHAEAHRIEIEIRYDPQTFRLRVRDDGKGIERQVLGKGRRAGHWGLPGIYERAQRIGAKLDLWSEAGAGTEIQVTFPAHLAYETPRSSFRLRLFRRAKR